MFPNAALLRLAGMLLEQNDEWLVSRRYLSEAPMAELTTHRPDLDSRKGATGRVRHTDDAGL